MKPYPPDRAATLLCQLYSQGALNTCDSATVGMVALDGKRLVVGLVGELRGGKLIQVDPIEELHLNHPLALSTESFERFRQALLDRFGAPAAALLCDRATFEGLLGAPSVSQYLAAVGHTQSFFYQLVL